MTAERTPGTWTAGPGKNGTIAIVARGWEVPLVANVTAKGRSSEEANANANLLAAAPDLLAALEAMIEEWNRHGCCDSRGVVDHARAIIAKAKPS